MFLAKIFSFTIAFLSIFIVKAVIISNPEYQPVIRKTNFLVVTKKMLIRLRIGG